MLELLYTQLTGQTVYLKNTTKLDVEVNQEYEIQITCSDGTDTSQTYVQLEIYKEKTEEDVPPGMHRLKINKKMDKIRGNY